MMAAGRKFLSRHAVAAYFVMVLLTSWGAFLAILGPGAFDATPAKIQAMLMPAILAMLLGPSVASLSLTLAIDGRAGVRQLLVRLRAWRARPATYVLAIVAGPAVAFALMLAFAAGWPVASYLPRFLVEGSPGSIAMAGLITALAAGIFEEIGWTGFATPRLRAGHSPLVAGLMLGFVWALWHVLPALWIWASVARGDGLALLGYVLDPFLFLMAYRVLMVTLYDASGSAPQAIVAHASLTATARILLPMLPAGPAMLAFDVAWALVTWAIALGVLRFLGGSSGHRWRAGTTPPAS